MAGDGEVGGVLNLGAGPSTDAQRAQKVDEYEDQ
jgi:hypothetical protein